MGLGGISLWQLLIILAIVVVIFGTKRLRTLGGDVGGAIKSFRKAMDSSDEPAKGSADQQQLSDDSVAASEPDAEFAESKDEKTPS